MTDIWSHKDRSGITAYGPALVLIAVFVAVNMWLSHDYPSSDLLATWLAGEAFASGQFDQIYPADTEFYIMHPPSSWQPQMAERGYEHDVFPFIYPPLWAWVAAQITALTDFATTAFVASGVNAALIGGMLCLAHRITGSRLAPIGFVAVGLALIIGTMIGRTGLIYNQPQILVSFLTLAALDAFLRRKDGAAGVILALAAAIKVYPVIYAVIWLGLGRWKSIRSFALTGAALGFMSVIVAGWPLHEVFLHQLALISDTILVINFNLSLDALMGRLVFVQDLATVVAAGAVSVDDGGWFAGSKPELWSVFSKGFLLAGLVASIFALRRARDPLAWGAVLIGLSYLSPLSWTYHYLAPVALAPALLDRLGLRTGGLVLLALFLPMQTGILTAIDAASPIPMTGFFVMSLCILALGVAFALAPRRKGADVRDA